MDERDETLYSKHGPVLLRMAAMLVGSANAEDVFAEAVLSATSARRWPGLDDDDRRAYLYRTVLNQARQWNRSRSRRERRELFVAAREHSIETDVVDTSIWEAVSRLGDRPRAVVFLTYYADLDGQAVASELGISERTVRRDLADARKRLRRWLDA